MVLKQTKEPVKEPTQNHWMFAIIFNSKLASSLEFKK
jgi:hypothetical protein